MGELGQDRPEGPIALTRFARALLAGTFVVAWGHPGPRGQARCRLKPRHIRPALRHDDFCPALVHPRNGVQEFDSACKGERGSLSLARGYVDAEGLQRRLNSLIEGVNLFVNKAP